MSKFKNNKWSELIMCNTCVNENELEVREYVNYQTGEKLDLERVKTLKDNAMLKVKPELWCIWDFEKNDELGLDIWKVKKSSRKMTPWWICPKFNHPYQMDIYCKINNYGCPYCSNHRLLVGFNDMWTTNPEQAKLLANPEDGYKYMQSASAKVDWKCLCCGEIVKNKSINNVNKRGFICPVCGEDVSFPEKIVINLLKALDVTFIHNRGFSWSKGKKYDFYIPSLNIIIETHGEQHYKEGFSTIKGGRTLEEEQVNDQYKYELAITNDIPPNKYIVIDCSRSEFSFIKSNILHSRLSKIFDLSQVDWDEIFVKSKKSTHLLILEMCRKGYTQNQIIEESTYSYGTVHSIIKNFVEMGLCEKPVHIFNSKKIYQYTKDGDFIRLWSGTKEILDELGFGRAYISECCTGKHKTAKGFIWSYTKLHED